MGGKLIYTFRNLDTRFCMVKYDPLPAANVNTFSLIALGSSLTDLVERTVHSLASNMRCWKQSHSLVTAGKKHGVTVK
jgi:hypothetical protein